MNYYAIKFMEAILIRIYLTGYLFIYLSNLNADYCSFHKRQKKIEKKKNIIISFRAKNLKHKRQLSLQ